MCPCVFLDIVLTCCCFSSSTTLLYLTEAHPYILPDLGMGGRRDGFININDMYNNDVGKGEHRVVKHMK